jgi:hypothetical protein
MKKKLFLDDWRQIRDVYPNADENEFDVVRSYQSFILYIKENGLPEFISFDNDLGFDWQRGKKHLSGYDAAQWLLEESGLSLRGLSFKVHSSDPSARFKISELLKPNV